MTNAKPTPRRRELTIGEQWKRDAIRRRRSDAVWAAVAFTATLLVITGYAVYISYFVVR